MGFAAKVNTNGGYFEMDCLIRRATNEVPQVRIIKGHCINLLGDDTFL